MIPPSRQETAESTGRSLRWTRRALLQLGAAVACLGPTGARAQRQGRPPERLRPQPGDGLVYAFGEQRGKKLLAEHVVRDAAPLLAYPVESSSGLVRDGSRLNQVLVIRLDPDALSVKAASRAADGIVAYSAVCTHTGCDVSGWRGEALRLVCPCHGSEFEATDAALVVSGPAPKPLAMLPLEVATGELRVVSGFTRRVGFQPQ